MTLLENYSAFDGIHWETGSTHNFFKARGFVNPHTGQPYSEPFLRGVSGGIVFGYMPYHANSAYMRAGHKIQLGMCDTGGTSQTVNRMVESLFGLRAGRRSIVKRSTGLDEPGQPEVRVAQLSCPIGDRRGRAGRFLFDRRTAGSDAATL